MCVGGGAGVGGWWVSEREREMWSREQKENERASKPGRRMRDGGEEEGGEGWWGGGWLW